LIATAIVRSCGSRSPLLVLTLPATRTETGTGLVRGSSLGLISPWKETIRSPLRLSSAWAAIPRQSSRAIVSAPRRSRRPIS
jgi:hypothetical protein